jgi:hypothetical protein
MVSMLLCSVYQGEPTFIILFCSPGDYIKEKIPPKMPTNGPKNLWIMLNYVPTRIFVSEKHILVRETEIHNSLNELLVRHN